MPQDGIKPYIATSHKRCRHYQIDEDRVISKQFVRGHALNQLLIDNSELIMTARPFIEQLVDFVRGSEFFAMLTDAEGCILSVSGDEEIVKKSRSYEMIPGAYMSEMCIGTNAMGTAIAEDMPVQISGKEHFIKAYHTWTCSGAPIHDENGEIIGALDLTGNLDAVHCHTLGMVVAAVKAIESSIILNRKNQLLKNSHALVRSLFDSIREGIIYIDKGGNIVSSNDQACKLLGYNKNNLESMRVQNLIEDWDSLCSMSIRSDIFNEEVRIHSNTNRLYFNVSLYRIHDQGSVQGCILMLGDAKKVRKLANKILGRKAIYTFDQIIGASRVMQETIQFAKKVADSKSTVLITGESGCGKELFSQAIHNYSPRRDEPFVAINSGAIPRTLIESELFGYDDGAFTGAKRGGQVGKFEIADGGTIFLDEIGEMPLEMQPKLLRVIEEGTIVRVGGTDEVSVDVRIIAATNKDLKAEVEKGNFRQDLYYRLNVIPIKLAPLSERREDIPLLVDHFMHIISKRINKKPIQISDADMQWLVNRPWQGNVRELENYIELAINKEKLEFDNGSAHGQGCEVVLPEVDGSSSLEEVEKKHIQHILHSVSNNITTAARILGIGRNTLYRKLEKHNIVLEK